MMSVAEAIEGRQSIRGFLDKPVPRAVLERVFEIAGRSPSGSNMQPWFVHVLQGRAKQALSDEILGLHHAGDLGRREYNYYPVTWRDPYLARRRRNGWGLYGLLGIARDDKAAMAEQHRKNYTFFGAPVGLIFSIDRDMERGSWLDMGMFIQSVMIAARGEGLDTCAQAAFCPYHEVVARHIALPSPRQIVCGMSVGYADPAAKINGFRAERVQVADFATWVGE